MQRGGASVGSDPLLRTQPANDDPKIEGTSPGLWWGRIRAGHSVITKKVG